MPILPPGNLNGPITFRHGEPLCGNPDLVAKLNAIAQKGDERLHSGTPKSLRIDYLPGVGYVLYVKGGEEETPVGTTIFAEVISYTVIVAGARWRYLVQPGTYSAEDDLAQTDPAFDSCWTLGPESGRIYVTNSVEQHNTSGLLTGGEGADMTVTGAWTKERRPLGVGDVVPLFWTGAIWMIFQPNNIATGCG